PLSARQASHSSKVTAYLPTANGSAIDTGTGSSSLNRPGSFEGEPIMKLPAGTTTISGQLGQSLKLSLGFTQRRSFPMKVSTPSHWAGEGVGLIATGSG